MRRLLWRDRRDGRETWQTVLTVTVTVTVTCGLDVSEGGALHTAGETGRDAIILLVLEVTLSTFIHFIGFIIGMTAGATRRALRVIWRALLVDLTIIGYVAFRDGPRVDGAVCVALGLGSPRSTGGSRGG